MDTYPHAINSHPHLQVFIFHFVFGGRLRLYCRFQFPDGLFGHADGVLQNFDIIFNPSLLLLQNLLLHSFLSLKLLEFSQSLLILVVEFLCLFELLLSCQFRRNGFSEDFLKSIPDLFGKGLLIQLKKLIELFLTVGQRGSDLLSFGLFAVQQLFSVLECLFCLLDAFSQVLDQVFFLGRHFSPLRYPSHFGLG